MSVYDDRTSAEPVRVKVYGLIRMTRRAYLTCQAAGLVLLVAVLVAWALAPRPPEGPGGEVRKMVFNLAPWAALIVLLAEAGETAFVLRAFARADAERRARHVADSSRPQSPPTGVSPGHPGEPIP